MSHAMYEEYNARRIQCTMHTMYEAYNVRVILCTRNTMYEYTLNTVQYHPGICYISVSMCMSASVCVFVIMRNICILLYSPEYLCACMP